MQVDAEHLGDEVAQQWQLVLFMGEEATKHVAVQCSHAVRRPRARAADAHLEPSEALCPRLAQNIVQAVVRTGAPLWRRGTAAAQGTGGAERVRGPQRQGKYVGVRGGPGPAAPTLGFRDSVPKGMLTSSYTTSSSSPRFSAIGLRFRR